jgi:hypothetical protein
MALSFGRDAYAFYLALSHPDLRQRIADCVGSIRSGEREKFLIELERIVPSRRLREEDREPLAIEKLLGDAKVTELLRWHIHRHSLTKSE